MLHDGLQENGFMGSVKILYFIYIEGHITSFTFRVSKSSPNWRVEKQQIIAKRPKKTQHRTYTLYQMRPEMRRTGDQVAALPPP